ncbi:phosphatase PAP2 family protein [Chryseoglobus sp. 28M-23]|uniref:phosphatase PAP2 family protein n=1 Tax=Chryseoglobus sp. 28M-23 TaxID=2772253 RepID=UPI0017477AE0|nr:phosphatase PAP2 family protein [Chryseoglobus sp. 28M-23]QOD93156.1 phosphatase PAP2 family protein [Chryseoglobus sp. 28M-23]
MGVLTDVLAGVLGGFAFVADIGRQAGWALLPATVVFLLIRRLPRAAVVLALGGLGGALLAAVVPLLVAVWLSTGEGGMNLAFFDDVLGLTVTSALLLMVFRPVLPAKRWWVLGTALLVVGFGTAAVASGSASLAVVLSAGAIGVLWAGAVGLLWRRWVSDQSGAQAAGWLTMAVGHSDRLRLAPERSSPSPSLARAVAALGAVLVLLAGTVAAIGSFVIVPSAAVQEVDDRIIDWFVSIRSDGLSALATVLDAAGNTPGIIAVQLAAVPIALALTRRRAPAVLLVTAVVGETAVYLVAGALVGRARPEVDHLSMMVPPTSSYPSGHVAATVVTYGAIALLVLAWSRSRWRYAVVPVAVLLVAGVVLARLYWGLHFATDTLASVVFAVVWLAACWRVIRPGPGPGPGSGRERAVSIRNAHTRAWREPPEIA